jgi:hypothetical protein
LPHVEGKLDQIDKDMVEYRGAQMAIGAGEPESLVDGSK